MLFRCDIVTAMVVMAVVIAKYIVGLTFLHGFLIVILILKYTHTP